MILSQPLLRDTKIYYFPCKSEQVILTLQFRAGEIYSPPGMNELAHLLEHMGITGSRKFPTKEALTYFSESQQIFVNAFTNHEYVRYVMMGDKKDLLKMFDATFSMAFEPTLKKSDFEQQKKVVLQELNQYRSDLDRQNAQNLASSLLKDFLTYDERLESLARITQSAMKKHHKETHTANNCNVFVAGDINENDIIELKTYAEKKLSKLPKHRPVKVKESILGSVKSGVIFDDSIKSSTTNFKLQIIYPRVTDKQYSTMRMIFGELGVGIGSILNIKGRKRGLIYGQFSGVFRDTKFTVLRFNTSLNSKNIPDYLNLIIAELKKVRTGLSKHQYTRAYNVQIMNEKNGLYSGDPIRCVNQMESIVDFQNGKSIAELLSISKLGDKLALPKPLAWRLSLTGGEKPSEEILHQLSDTIHKTFAI